MVGGFIPFQKIVNWDEYLQYMGNKKQVPNHQPAYVYIYIYTDLYSHPEVDRIW